MWGRDYASSYHFSTLELEWTPLTFSDFSLYFKERCDETWEGTRMSAWEKDSLSHDTHTCVGLLTWLGAWKYLQHQSTSPIFSEESHRQWISAKVPIPNRKLFKSSGSRIRVLYCFKLYVVCYNHVALLDISTLTNFSQESPFLAHLLYAVSPLTSNSDPW